MKKRIVICGGRKFRDAELFDRVIEHASRFFDDRFCIIHGGAPGADRMGSIWAFQRGKPIINMPANWDFYDNEAGPIRNGWLLEFGMPDLVIAFPGNNGTADMIAQTKARGIDIWIVPANWGREETRIEIERRIMKDVRDNLFVAKEK